MKVYIGYAGSGIYAGVTPGGVNAGWLLLRHYIAQSAYVYYTDIGVTTY